MQFLSTFIFSTMLKYRNYQNYQKTKLSPDKDWGIFV